MQGLKNFIIRTEHGEERSNERTMSEVHTSGRNTSIIPILDQNR